MKRTAHIISHTHWDREWYLNSTYTNEWLIPFFERLFAMLEKQPSYCFVLDGQLCMIEDYLEQLRCSGHSSSTAEEKLRHYVARKQLFVGPYYLQPDWQLLSEESLVRNFLYGDKVAKRFGERMAVGWMLDNFGQISQTSQLHREAGIEALFVWRGVEMEPAKIQSEFYWRSPDGSQVLAVYMLNSYRNAMRLAEHPKLLRRRIVDEVEKMGGFATTPNVLLMNGYDQELVPDDILPAIEQGKMDSDVLEVMQSDPPRFVAAIKAAESHLPTLEGALCSGRYIAVFPGVLSARVYLKQQNDASERALSRYAEPLSALLWLRGLDYDGVVLEQAWKTLLKNHPHDSICGVSIDDVHSDMERRTRVVNQLIEGQLQTKLDQLAGQVDTTSFKRPLLVFNPSAVARSGVVNGRSGSRYITDVPALGYRVIDEAQRDALPGGVTPVQVGSGTLENGLIRVTVHADGTFDLEDLRTKKRFCGFGVFADSGDAGDEYNYSAPDEDTVIRSEGGQADIEVAEQQDHRAALRVSLTLTVPQQLTDDRKRRSSDLTRLSIASTLSIEAGSPVLRVQIRLSNSVKDHRLRVLFPTGLAAHSSRAGSPFDLVERKIAEHAPYDETELPDDVRRVIVGARETRPISQFVSREIVDVSDGRTGLAVFSRGLLECEVLPAQTTIALTLFRAVGWVAKQINSRSGDAGPEIFTPQAQCFRPLQFDYAVCPHQGDLAQQGVLRELDAFCTPLLVASVPAGSGPLSANAGLVCFEPSDTPVRLTGCKRTEDGSAVVVRCYNSATHPTDVDLVLGFAATGAAACDLLEQPVGGPLPLRGRRLRLELPAKKIISVRIEAQRGAAQPAAGACAHRIDQGGRLDVTADAAGEPSERVTRLEVTAADVAAERVRAETLLPGLEHASTRRTALEAQLSALLAQRRLDEHRIRELGYQLNDARVQRRVWDYIREYSDGSDGSG